MLELYSCPELFKVADNNPFGLKLTPEALEGAQAYAATWHLTASGFMRW